MKSIQRVDYLGMAGIVQSVSRGAWDFIYRVSTVRDTKWNIGDRVVLPDGREFVYSKSSAACISGQGCEFTYTGYTAITTFGVSAAVGVVSVTVPAATHATLTEDELAGGYICIFDGSTNNTQFRGIVGNAAAASGAAFVVYLDGALTEAVVAATSKCETYQNPYAALRTGTDVALAKAGVPAVKVTAGSMYFWVQRAGITWAAPQSGITGKNRGACWRHDGSLDTIDNGVEDNAYVSSQIAGYAVTGSAEGNGPLFMLQG
jgi:hypothetical protein